MTGTGSHHDLFDCIRTTQRQGRAVGSDSRQASTLSPPNAKDRGDFGRDGLRAVLQPGKILGGGSGDCGEFHIDHFGKGQMSDWTSKYLLNPTSILFGLFLFGNGPIPFMVTSAQTKSQRHPPHILFLYLRAEPNHVGLALGHTRFDFPHVIP